MTCGEYIAQSMDGFKLNEAAVADVFLTAGCSADDEYTSSVADGLWKAVIPVLERVLLSPYVSNVSESGFSLSWNREKAGSFYLWLCRKYGVTPDADITGVLGVSLIRDRSDVW